MLGRLGDDQGHVAARIIGYRGRTPDLNQRNEPRLTKTYGTAQRRNSVVINHKQEVVPWRGQVAARWGIYVELTRCSVEVEAQEALVLIEGVGDRPEPEEGDLYNGPWGWGRD